jgi:hypothetical protein
MLQFFVNMCAKNGKNPFAILTQNTAIRAQKHCLSRKSHFFEIARNSCHFRSAVTLHGGTNIHRRNQKTIICSMQLFVSYSPTFISGKIGS